MGQPTKISVSSNIRDMVMKNVELEVEPKKKGQSWLALLMDSRNGLNVQLKQKLDPETMMIRSTGRNIMTALNEPIQKFLDQYTKKVKIYRVQIVKTKSNSSTRETLEARRLTLKIERDVEEMSSSSSSGTPAPSLPRAPKRVGEIRKSGGRKSGEHSGAAAAGRKKPKLNLPGPSKYPEDAPNFAPSVPVGVVEENQADMDDDEDNDDNASQCSQDSQDPGVDLKSEVLQRFQNCAKDGDILRIVSELQAVNRKNKWMRFSRDMPHTMNLLNITFRPQLDD